MDPGENWVFFLVDMLGRKSLKWVFFWKKQDFFWGGMFLLSLSVVWANWGTFVENIRPTLTCYKIPGIILSLKLIDIFHCFFSSIHIYVRQFAVC